MTQNQPTCSGDKTEDVVIEKREMMSLLEDQAQELSVGHILPNVVSQSLHLRQVVLNHNKTEVLTVWVISSYSLTEGATKQKSFLETDTGCGPGEYTEAGGSLVRPAVPVCSRADVWFLCPAPSLS